MGDNLETMEMEQDLAQHLFKTGAILIIAGLPIGTEFGIDLCSYSVGERFRGIKMIPPGPHYIYCASKDPYGESAPRVGFIHYFKSSEIVIREWDPNNEELRIRQTNDPNLEKKRIRDNLEDLDRFLAPYNYNNFQRWKYLTDAISTDVISRCAPDCGLVRTSVEYLSCPDSERPRGGYPGNVKLLAQSVADESDLLPNLKPIPGTALKFTKLPERVPKGCSPEEISMHHIDSISAVDLLLGKFEQDIGLIQEIQLAFVFFCAGCSVDGLSHWRKILNILSNSEAAVIKHRSLYMRYLELLKHQLPELPEELMEQNDKNTVYKDVRNLVLNCTLGGLHKSGERLTKSLNETMRWTFDGLLDEDPEDMPVIIDTE